MSLPFVDYHHNQFTDLNSRWTPIHGEPYFSLIDSLMFTNKTNSGIIISMKIDRHLTEDTNSVESFDFVYAFPLGPLETSEFLVGKSLHMPASDILYARSDDTRHSFHTFVSFRTLKEIAS